MEIVLITLIVFGIAIVAMLVGQRLTGRCLRGSCGGPIVGPDGEEISCEGCPRKAQPRSD